MRRLQATAQKITFPSQGKEKCLISIKGGTFWQDHPASGKNVSLNPPLFPNLKFYLPATKPEYVRQPVRETGHVAVIGTNPTPFLNVLRGDYICTPPGARQHPYLSSSYVRDKDPRLSIPSRAIHYVGFNNSTGTSSGGSAGVRGAYLSARYESRREETDWSVSQYLRGETELNPSNESGAMATDETLFKKVVRDLRLEKLLDMPVSNLSNGQTRRSRIASALLGKPEVLLLDEPFMGLDPPTLVTLNPILKDLAFKSSPLLVLGLRPQDPIPDWIDRLVVLGDNNTVVIQSSTAAVLCFMYHWNKAYRGESGVADADVEEAKTLARTHGPPSFSVASILTSQGIHECTAVEEAWTIIQKARLDQPKKDAESLHQLFRKRKALEIPPAERTREDERAASRRTSSDQIAAYEHIRSSIKKASTTKPSSAQSDEQNSDIESTSTNPPSETLVELNSIIVKYGSKVVLGHLPTQPGFNDQGLNLTISRGTRLLLLGPNGSGKTTLLSLLTSDHPQSYSLPIKFFGRTRLPEPGKPGLSLWEIQSRIGHSSPEVHAFFPRGLTVRQVLESAWAETFSSKPAMTAERSAMVDHFLRVWKTELCHTPEVDAADMSLEWASDKVVHPAFGRLSFGTQRLLLLLRAIIKQPDIIILDEGFSGLPATVRDKALGWLEKGDESLRSSVDDGVVFPGLIDQQALVVVSHVREEVPDCVTEYVRLPSEEEAVESQKTILIGQSDRGHIKSADGWNRIWGV